MPPQLEEERDAWERWYLVLRAHLTAYRRPTATWSPAAATAAAAAAAAVASSANASDESPALAASGGEPDSSEEENAAAAAMVAATVGRGQGRGRGGSSGNNSRSNAGGGDGRGKRDGGIDAALLRAGGEEEEEEERVRSLQEVVMKRAGLEGEFDMKKVRCRLALARVRESVAVDLRCGRSVWVRGMGLTSRVFQKLR